MSEILIKTQAELNQLTEINVNDIVKIESKEDLKLNCIIKVFGKLIIDAKISCNYWDNRFFLVTGNSHAAIKNRENSQATIENLGNSQVTINNWENSHVTIKNRENSHVTIKNWENSQVIIENWENSVLRLLYVSIFSTIKINLFGFSVCFKPSKIKIKIKKAKTSIIQDIKFQDFFKRHDINRNKKEFIFYKRVSKDFKTQENTNNETIWQVGKTLIHSAWNPSEDECGSGQFYCCPFPFFCDDFRNIKNDRYIAIKIKKEDLYEWKDNPEYPHKIGFRKGKVLYECDREGNKI